jgi:Spy/CpxP family protein refolding chaperone
MKIRRLLVVSLLMAPAYAAGAALAQSSAISAVKPAISAVKPVVSAVKFANGDYQLADGLLADGGPVIDMAFGSEMPDSDFGPTLAMGPAGPGFGTGAPGFEPGCGPGGPGAKFFAAFGPPMMGHPMGPPMMGPGFPPPFPMAGIELSDDQVEKIAGIKAGKREKSMVVMSKLQPLERQFHQALAQAEINSADIGRLKADIAAQKAALEQLHADEIVEVAQVLTPEQRKKIYQSMLRAQLGPMGMREHKPHGDGSQK